MPRDGTTTRERILEAAQRLVIDRGFSATSVDAVLAAAETSKGAFFNHFPTKDALARALVDRYVASDLTFLRAGLDAARDGTAAERAVAFLRFYENTADELVTNTTGCLYTSVLAELGLASSGSGDPIAHAVTTWRDGYARILRAALPEHDEAFVADLSDHVFVTFEGGYLLARAMNDPTHLRRQLRVLRRLVEALL